MPTPTKVTKKQPKLIELKLHEKQAVAYRSKKQFIFVITGAQAGKSTFGAIWLIREIAKHPYDNFAIVASTYKVLTQATIQVFELWAPKGMFTFKSAQNKMYYEINHKKFGVPERKGEGKIFVRSSERADDLVGMTLRAVWFDEAGNAPKRAWINLKNRVVALGGRILITTTPYTFNWVKDEVDKAIAGEPTYEYVNFPTSANPAIPKEGIEADRRTMTREDFERVYEGRFTRPEGVIYDCFDPDEMIISKTEWEKMKKDDPVLEMICGIDWGYTDPNVQMVIAVHASGKFVVVEEVYQTKATMEVIIDKARQLSKKYKISIRYADSAYPAYIEKFNNTRIDEAAPPHTPRNHLMTVAVKKSPDSTTQTYLQQGISRVQSLMFDGKFLVIRDNEELIKELASYRWKTVEDSMGKNMVTQTPEDRQADHGVDSVRYAIDTHWPKRPQQSPIIEQGTTLNRYMRLLQADQKNTTGIYQRQLDQFSQDGF